MAIIDTLILYVKISSIHSIISKSLEVCQKVYDYAFQFSNFTL
jgi:hypothetical protein